MKNKHGITLIELTVVIAIIITLSAIGLVGVKTLENSFINTCSKGVINGLLNSARTTAIARQTYTGIRFQKQDDTQYAIFITHDSNISYPDDNKTIPFTAITGHPLFNLGKANIDETTIVFSSQGKLVRKLVKIFPARTKDDIFGQYGLFPQDEYSILSNNSLIIKIHNDLKEFYINPYIGTLIDVNR